MAGGGAIVALAQQGSLRLRGDAPPMPAPAPVKAPRGSAKPVRAVRKRKKPS